MKKSLILTLILLSQLITPAPVKAETQTDSLEEFFQPAQMSLVDFLNSFMSINIHLQDYDIERFNYHVFDLAEPYGYLHDDPRPYQDFIQIGDTNPYTEAQLVEFIANMSPYQPEPHFEIGDGGYALKSFRDMVEYNIKTAFYRGHSQTAMNLVFIFINPAVESQETDTEFIDHYVVKDHLMTEELILTADKSQYNITSMLFTQTTPKSYEAIPINQADLEAYQANPDQIQDLFNRLGTFHSHHVQVLENDLVDTLTWVDLGYPGRQQNDSEIASLSITFPSAQNEDFIYEIELISEDGQ